MPDEVNDALDKALVLIPATGFVYIAPVGTARPKLPCDPQDKSKWVPSDPAITEPDKIAEWAELWKDIGNTSLDNGVEHEVEGDDPETLGSWQNPALKSTSPPKIFSVTLNLEDFTKETYRLYYGAGEDAYNDTEKTFTIPSLPSPQEQAMLIVATDGKYQVVEFYKKVSIIGSDAITYDPKALTEMPVKATVLGATYGGKTAMGEVSPRLENPTAVKPNAAPKPNPTR